MPARWQVPLQGPGGVDVPLEAPHAVVSRWLDADHKAAVKPYAICPPFADGTLTVIEVRLLDDRLGERLVASVPAGAPVRLGSHHFTVAAPARRVEARSWAELLAPPPKPARSWLLRFLTPATFRRGDRSSPWPAPESVTRSLADRWRVLDPASAPVYPAGGYRSLWVSDLEGRSVAVRRAGLIASGFVGRIRYVCEGPDTEAAVVDALLRFATYAGVGSHTAFGFGVTEVAPDAGTSAPARRTAAVSGG